MNAPVSALNDVVTRARAARERTGHWPGSHAEALCNEVERLQRALNQRNEQIDGYERQLGIDNAGAERTIESEIERLIPMAQSWESYEAAQERKASLASNPKTPRELIVALTECVASYVDQQRYASVLRSIEYRMENEEAGCTTFQVRNGPVSMPCDHCGLSVSDHRCPPVETSAFLNHANPEPVDCQHDLLRPDTTIEVIDPWKAKCKVCITFFDLPGRPAQKATSNPAPSAAGELLAAPSREGAESATVGAVPRKFDAYCTDPAFRLATMALQSDRYLADADFRDVTDDVLAAYGVPRIDRGAVKTSCEGVPMDKRTDQPGPHDDLPVEQNP